MTVLERTWAFDSSCTVDERGNVDVEIDNAALTVTHRLTRWERLRWKAGLRPKVDLSGVTLAVNIADGTVAIVEETE